MPWSVWLTERPPKRTTNFSVPPQPDLATLWYAWSVPASNSPSLDTQVALEPLEPLALLWGASRRVCEGLYGGLHPSARKGAGIEFHGRRPYVVGDDVRGIEPASWLGDQWPMVRERTTDTERAVLTLLDGSGSMGYRSQAHLPTKAEYSALLAASLLRIAQATGDAIAASWLGASAVRPGRGTPALRQAMHTLTERPSFAEDEARWLGTIDTALGSLRYGTLTVLFTDAIAFPEASWRRLLARTTGRGALLSVVVHDPTEAGFPFTGTHEFHGQEGERPVSTLAQESRASYLAARESALEAMRNSLAIRGGRMVVVTTDSAPVASLRALLQSARECQW